MAKANYLTRESNAIWATALREAKNGTYTPGRAAERAVSWAQWKLTSLGVSLPASFRTRMIDGNAVEFSVYVDVEVPGTRMSLGQSVTARSTRRERQVLATVGLPAWCQPVKNAETWITANLGEV
jgi:hypothetical protein